MYKDIYGNGKCDCLVNFYRHIDGKCYQKNTRGWCEEGQILKIYNPEPGECRTKQTSKKNMRSNGACIFPWTHRSKTYDGCKDDPENPGETWCSTKVDSDGNHVTGEDEWGLCGDGCPITGAPITIQRAIVFEKAEVIVLKLQKWLASEESPKLVCRENTCPVGQLPWDSSTEE